MDTIWLVLLVLLVVGLICACYYFWPHIKNFFGGRNLKRTKKRRNKKKHSRELSSERNSKFESGSCRTSGQYSDTPPRKKRKDSRARAVSTEPNGSSQETSPQGTSSQKTTSQETTKKGTTTKGTSSKRTTSQGTTSQGTTSQGASSKGRTSKGTTLQGTTQPRTTEGGFSQGSTEATPNPFQYYNNRCPPPPLSYPNPPPKKKTRKDSRARAVSNGPNGSSQGTSPLRTSSQGTTSQGTTSQGVSSLGTTSLGTTTKGSTTKGSTTKGTTTKGTTTKGTTPPRTTEGGFSQSSTEATPNPYQYYNNRYPPPPPSYPNPYLDPRTYNPYQQSPMSYPDRYPNYYPTSTQLTSPRPSYNPPERPLYSPSMNKPTNYQTSNTIDPRTQWNGQQFPTRTNQPNANQWGTNERRIQTDQKKSKNFLQKAYKHKNPLKWFKKRKKDKYPQPEVPEVPTNHTYVSTNKQPSPPTADTKKKRGFFGLFKWKKKDPPTVYQTNPENTQQVMMNQAEPKKKKKWWKWNRKKKIPPPPQGSRDILMTNTNQSIKRPKAKGNYQVGEIPAFRKQPKKDNNNKIGTTVKGSPKVSREDKEKKPYTEYDQETPMPSAPQEPFNEPPQEIQFKRDFQAFEPQVFEPQVLLTPEQMAELRRLYGNGNHYEENPFPFIGPPIPPAYVKFNCPCAECANYGHMLKHNIFDVPICPQHLFHTDKSCVNCKTFYRKLTSGYAVKSINVPKNKNCRNICAVHQTQACLDHNYRREPAECAVCSGLEAQMRAGLRCTCFMMCLSCCVLYKNHQHLKVICCHACARLCSNTLPEKDYLLCRAHDRHIDPENCGECEDYWKNARIGNFDYKLFMDEIEIPQLDYQGLFGIQ